MIRNVFGATEVRDNHKRRNKYDDDDGDDGFESNKNLDGEEYHW